MARTCGECTLCCKVMGVTSLQKPRDRWCQHCEPGKGCQIYEQRPAECREFRCLWLDWEWMPEDLRPDKSKVVLFSNVDDRVQAMVPPEYPAAVEKPAMKLLLETIANHDVDVIIGCGDARRLLTTNGTPGEIVEMGFVDVSPLLNRQR
jgi:hypothetical protein